MKTALRVAVMLVAALPACQWLAGIDDRKVSLPGSDASGSGGAVSEIDGPSGSGGARNLDGGPATGDVAILGGTLGTGGKTGLGGTPGVDVGAGTGGVTSTGGVLGTGGTTNRLDAGSSGGATGRGGATMAGGTSGSGGKTATGGIVGTGGATGLGGVTGRGGATGMGGVPGSGGVPGTGGTMVKGGAGGNGGAGGQGGRCEETMSSCGQDLSNVGTGDFEIKFTITTSTTAFSEVLNQRSVCNHSFFWDIQLKDGTLQVEVDDNGQHYTSCRGTTLVNDGKPHRVVSRRAGGKLATYVDCVLDSMCACATDFSTTLAPLRTTLAGCATPPPDLVGSLSEVCVSSSNVDGGVGGAGGAGGAGGTGGTTGVAPSCDGLQATCGPGLSGDCCASSTVPSGSFNRSSDPSLPATVSSYRLDTYEISVGRFRKFVAAYPANKPAPGSGKNPSNPADGGWDSAWNSSLLDTQAALISAVQCDQFTWNSKNDSLPMNCITWFEAEAFCIWDGGRLPTQAEWELAAVGGAEERYYPWSVPPTSQTISGAYAVYSTSSPAAVGSDSPTGDARWGQSDMAGNVHEWAQDWYAPYSAGLCDNCANLTPSSERVFLGGSYPDTDVQVYLSIRSNRRPPTWRDRNVGARCARPVIVESAARRLDDRQLPRRTHPQSQIEGLR